MKGSGEVIDPSKGNQDGYHRALEKGDVVILLRISDTVSNDFAILLDQNFP